MAMATMAPLKVKNTFVEFGNDEDWEFDMIKRQETAPAKFFHRQVSAVPVFESIPETDESHNNSQKCGDEKYLPSQICGSPGSGSGEPEAEPADSPKGRRLGEGLQSAILQEFNRQISDGWHVTNPNRQSSELSTASWGRQETVENWPMWEQPVQRMERATSQRLSAQPVQTVQTVKEEEQEEQDDHSLPSNGKDEQDGNAPDMTLPWQQQMGMQFPFFTPLSMPWPYLAAAGAYPGGNIPEHWQPGLDGAHAGLQKKPAPVRPMSKRKAKSLITLAAEAKMQQQPNELPQQTQPSPQQSMQMLQQQQQQLAQAAIRAEEDMSLHDTTRKLNAEMLQQHQQKLVQAAIKAENGLHFIDAADNHKGEQSKQGQVAQFCPHCGGKVTRSHKFCVFCSGSIAHLWNM